MLIRSLIRRRALGRFVVGVCVASLFGLALAACSGGDAETSATEDAAETAEPKPTIELFPIPSPTVQPTATAVPPTPQADGDPQDEEPGSADPEAEEPEGDGPAGSTGVSARDSSVVWIHVEGLDLEFTDGRPALPASVDTFYAVGEGDIAESVETILASINHPLTWQDAADAALATFPDGLGESAGIFTLLSTQWAVIGCESHLAGMSRPSWNRHLFDHLVADAAGLPAEQADNQAGILLNGSNAAIDVLCPRLVRGV